MFSTELKIKRLSLVAEARIIAAEEERLARRVARRLIKQKKPGPDYFAIGRLRHHRLTAVRPAARAAHLAHTYLKGGAYATVEDPARTRTLPDEERVAENVRTFGPTSLRGMDKKMLVRAIEQWISGGAPVGVEASNPQTAGSTPVAASNLSG